MKKRGPDDEGFAFFHRTESISWHFGGEDTPEEVYENKLPHTPTGRFGDKLPTEDIVLAFGHRRLSILDLSPAGHQPMCTEDKRYWIVHNGEIYNYLEIREKLEAKGDSFFSNTDTEVILKAYREWGPDCLNLFNGMWAFAIWDNQKKELFCSRDRIGIKPFYYYMDDKIFLLASDIKTLIASGLYCPEPNWEGIYHAMSFYCAPRPMTCFKGVKALEQAHWMTIDLKGRIKKNRYWQMPVGQIDYSKTEEEWCEALEHTLRLAVKRRLIADVPVGTFMSGGIDSTTISAIAAQEHPGIKAFTLAYEREANEFDEIPQAKATAKMYPLRHIIKQVRPEETLQYLEDMTRCYEEPFCSLAPNYVISQLVSENNVKVVLNGLGGDELFLGYGREKRLKLLNMVGFWRNILKLLPPLNKTVKKIKQFSSLNDIFEYYVYRFSTFTEDQKRSIFSEIAKKWDSYKTFKTLYGLEELKFNNPIEALCYMDIINYIGNHHVYRVDQFTMNFSLEGRFPFLDHELVELACRIPRKFKVHNRQGKYILRQVAKKLIHPSSLSMQKKGFGLPVKYWMTSSLKPMIKKKIESLKKRGVMNPEEIERIKDSFEQGKTQYQQLWFLVSLELWLEMFIDSNEYSFNYSSR